MRSARREASHAPRKNWTDHLPDEVQRRRCSLPSPGQTPRRTCVRGGQPQLQRSPCAPDLLQPVCDSHEHDVDRLPHNDVFCAHAVDRTACSEIANALGPVLGQRSGMTPERDRLLRRGCHVDGKMSAYGRRRRDRCTGDAEGTHVCDRQSPRLRSARAVPVRFACGRRVYPGKSDLDLMAIVAAEVEEGQQLESLRSLHDAFVSERPAWVERVEVAYVDRGVLQTFGDRPSGRIAVINPGEPLHIRDAGYDSTLDWHSVTQRARQFSVLHRLIWPDGQPRCLQARRGSPAERVAEQSSCAVGRLRSRAPGLRGDDALPRPLRARNRRADDKGGGSGLGRSQIPRVVELHQRSPSDLPRRCA